MKKFYSLFFIFLFSLQIIYSQNPVTLTTSVNKISENRYELVTSSEIENEWRLYSQFLEEGGALPTEFVFENAQKSSYQLIGEMKESESITKYDPVFRMDQTYFINTNTFKQEIKLYDSNIDKIHATIFYQTCNDSVCINNESELVFNLDGSLEDAFNKDLTTLILDDNNPLKLDLKNTELLTKNSSKESISGNNYFDLLILGFIGGLLALLTPCVFPMIPLTVSFFTKKKSKSSLKAIVYGLFIILVYLILSIPFYFIESIDPEILNTISTNAWLNILFFIIFIIFAFSFFGFYELTIPSSWINSIDSKSNTIGGYIGVFFMSLTLVLVSFSCTGPILGSLLVGSISSQGGAIQLSIGMFGFGLALALPFTLFALFLTFLFLS